MKEKLLSAIKKIAVIFIASIMVLGIVPIGIITMSPRTAKAEGEFLRLSPVEEISVMSQVETKKLIPQGQQGLHPVGRKADAYFKFDLQSLIENKDLAEIQQATLRLVAVKTYAEHKQAAQLWLMPSSDWNTGMNYESRPATLGEVKLAELNVDATQAAGLVEVDVTEYLKKWVEEKNRWVSLHFGGAQDGARIIFAGTQYEDPMYRPCLKIVTGEAEDADTQDLTKVWTEKSAQSPMAQQDGVFRVGNGKEVYLKFQLKPENIRGVMYRASLRLNTVSMDETAQLVVHQLCDGRWDAGMTLPEGQEMQLDAPYVIYTGGVMSLDLTDAVNDAYAKGETQLTLKLSGNTQGEMAFVAWGKDAPELKLQVSDQSHIVAVTEAAIYALDDNVSKDAITKNLSESYTTEAGVRAQVRWTAEDPQTGEPMDAVISSRGQITRPQWFENAKVVRATATITAEDYTRKRNYTLTVQPQEMPSLATEAGDCINLGIGAEETKHVFGEVGTTSHIHWVGSKPFSYRRLTPDGMLAMYLAVDPEKQNYITVKVWNADRPTAKLQIENLSDRTAAPILCNPPEALEAEDGFLYLTYPLPLAQTEGKQYLAVRFSEGQGEIEEGYVPWHIYNVYSTQTPYFDPLTFGEQGETFAGKKTATDSGFVRLLKRLYTAAKQSGEQFVRGLGVWQETMPETSVEEITQERFVWMDTQPPMFAFDDEGDRIAVSVWEKEGKAEVHRASAYYDTYAQVPWTNYGSGLYAMNYGRYRIFKNTAARERTVPYQKEALAGVYQDLLHESYYVFLEDGQMIDDSVLTPDTILQSGKDAKIKGRSTMVLEQLAEPLVQAQWRIAAVNGRPIAQVKLNQSLAISSITIKNVGKTPDQKETLQVICCTYEKGLLSGIERRAVTIIPGRTEYTVSIPTITVEPGQTLKIFVEPTEQEPAEMIPELELPQQAS